MLPNQEKGLILNWAALLAGLGVGLLVSAGVVFAAFTTVVPVNDLIATLVNQTSSKGYVAATLKVSGEALGALKAVQYNINELREKQNAFCANIVYTLIGLTVAGITSLILALIIKLRKKPAHPPPP